MPTLPLWIATAGCPSATVTADLLAATADLIGFPEFAGTPKKSYRKYTLSGSVATHDASRSPVATYTVAGNGLSANYFNADGSWSLSFINPDLTQTPGNYGGTDQYFAWSQLAQPPAVDGIWWDPFAGQDTTTPTATTQVWTPVPVGAGSTASGSLTATLSEEDTDDDAITRAASFGSTSEITAGPNPADIFAAGIFSLHEMKTALSFGYQGGTYQLNYTGLAPGQNYHYVVVWEQRTAEGDGSGDMSLYGASWSNSDSQSGDFTASGVSQVISGLSIPIAAGYQKRIKSISITAV